MPDRRLIPSLVRPEDLCEADVDDMWSLTCATMAECPRDVFDTMVRAAHRVVVVRDAGRRRVRGYCAAEVATLRTHRVPARVIITRLTVIDGRYRGQAVLNRGLTRLALRERVTHLGRLYVFAPLISFRMYSKLVKWLPAAWPSRARDWPPRERELRDAIARERFGAKFSPDSGTTAPAGIRLREELTVPPAAWSRDPDVAFFEKANPHHSEGALLLCLARLDAYTFVVIALRFLRRGRASGSGARVAREQAGAPTTQFQGRAPRSSRAKLTPPGEST